MPTLLQVCNVGTVLGGTGACAVSIARSLPRYSHHLWCFGAIRDDLKEVWRGGEPRTINGLDGKEITRLNPDMVILHNTGRGRVIGEWRAKTVQYVHSRIDFYRAEKTLYCSRYLARQFGARDEQVWWQPVPLPFRPKVMRQPRKFATDELVVGRLCTPGMKKYPRELLEVYELLSQSHPHIRWEFVGAPSELASDLQRACAGRATFHAAGWGKRELLWKWDVLFYTHPTLTETFGRTVAEAMRTGCVPVVDARGGFVEQLEGGGGVLCNDLGQFVAALAKVSRPDVWEDLSVTGRRVADERHSLGVFARRLLGGSDDGLGMMDDGGEEWGDAA
jgi:glycosyltransferase involved in cell wall biosynthesis